MKGLLRFNGSAMRDLPVVLMFYLFPFLSLFAHWSGSGMINYDYAWIALLIGTLFVMPRMMKRPHLLLLAVIACLIICKYLIPYAFYDNLAVKASVMDIKWFAYLVLALLWVNRCGPPSVDRLYRGGVFFSVLYILFFLARIGDGHLASRAGILNEANYDGFMILMAYCVADDTQVKSKWGNAALIVATLCTLSRTGIASLFALNLIKYVKRNPVYLLGLLPLMAGILYLGLSIRGGSSAGNMDRFIYFSQALVYFNLADWPVLLFGSIPGRSLDMPVLPEFGWTVSHFEEMHGLSGIYPFYFHSTYLRLAFTWGIPLAAAFILSLVYGYFKSDSSVVKNLCLVSLIQGFSLSLLTLPNVSLLLFLTFMAATAAARKRARNAPPLECSLKWLTDRLKQAQIPSAPPIRWTARAFFYLFFLPIFSLKMLDITTGNLLLSVVAALSFVLLGLHILQERYEYRMLRVLFPLLLFTMVLMFTCGKAGAFFSVLMIWALKGCTLDKRFYRPIYLVGIFALLFACYLGRNGEAVMRYMNGEWVEMIKRSNLLYVSYTAIVSLYLLQHRDTLRGKHLWGIAIVSYFLFWYVGSRTGFMAILLLLLMIVLFRSERLRRLRLLRYGCILSPLFCMIFSVYSGWMYGRSDFLTILDMMLQGRIYQNNAYWERYDLKLFGQPIYEGSEHGEFWNLDCAYLDMLICEGVLFAVLWVVVSMVVIRYYYRKGAMIEVAMLVMYAIYGISETFLPNCFLNISLFLYGEYLYDRLRRSRSRIPLRRQPELIC